MAELWHRQPKERTKAWNAFKLYRDLGDDRTQEKVRNALGRSTGYSRQIEVWSSKFKWVSRVEAYEAHLDEQRLKINEKAIMEMNERQALAGVALQRIGLTKFTTLPKDKDGNVDAQAILKAISNSEAIRAIETGSKLERTARGEPTEIQGDKLVEVDDTVADALVKAYGKVQDKNKD